MGKVINISSYFGGKPKQTGTPGVKPSWHEYKFGKHASNVAIKGGKVGFFNDVSNLKWDNLLITKSGKREFKINRGKDKITTRELKKEIGKMLEKSSGQRYTGKRLKEHLVKKMGMKYQDADLVARAATYHYYEAPPEGPSKEDIARRINAIRATAGMADNLNSKRLGSRVKKDAEESFSTRLNVKGREYKTSAAVGSTTMSEDDVRKDGKSDYAAQDKQTGTAAIGGGTENKKGVASGMGAKEAEDKKVTSLEEFKKRKVVAKTANFVSLKPVGGAVGTKRKVSLGPESPQDIAKGLHANNEYFYTPGQVRSEKTDKKLDFHELAVKHGLAADDYNGKNGDDSLTPKTDILPETDTPVLTDDQTEAADDYDEEDAKKAA